MPRKLGLLAVLVLLFTSGCFSAAGEPAATAASLRVALAFPPAQALSPYGDDGVILTRLSVAETLVALDPAGLPVPALAASWTRTGDLSWSFRLRGGVLFHDGTELHAKEAAAALNSAAAASPLPRALKGTKIVARASGQDELVVTTAAPDPVLPQRLSSPNLVILAPAAYRTHPVDPVRAGTGAFVLEQVKGVTGATLSAFARYWGGAPAARGVEVSFLPDANARVAGLRAGELDVAEAIPAAQAASVPAGRLLEIPLPRTVLLYLNATSGVFTDAGLRAAARSSVDANAIATSVYEGRADTATGLFGPASPWAANRPAGQHHTPATTVPAGKVIRLATYSDRAELPEVASALADSLRRKGFTVEQTVRDYAALEPDLLAGAFDAVVGNRSYALDTGDAGLFLASDATCAGSYNLAHLCNADVDKAIAAATAPTDPVARQQAALTAEAAVLATDTMIPIVHERARIGVADRIDGVVPDPFERALVDKLTRRQ